MQALMCFVASLRVYRAKSPYVQGEAAPNPSIERTCPGEPGHASHVKR
jgi:hypothetical protein